MAIVSSIIRIESFYVDGDVAVSDPGEMFFAFSVLVTEMESCRGLVEWTVFRSGLVPDTEFDRPLTEWNEFRTDVFNVIAAVEKVA